MQWNLNKEEMGSYGYEIEMQGDGVKYIFDPWTCELEEVRNICQIGPWKMCQKRRLPDIERKHDEIVPLQQ